MPGKYEHAATRRRTTGALDSAASLDPGKETAAQRATLTGTFRSFHDGTRERVRIGEQSDGKFGVRIWDSAGTLQVNDTWA